MCHFGISLAIHRAAQSTQISPSSPSSCH
ncbi:hypothetical protein A2U01_0085327, partial [Trifolium medium]|nr:hypothetical protein [Trifolium medium]